MQKTCENCHKEYDARRGNQKYCSKSCCSSVSKKAYWERIRGEAKWHPKPSTIKVCPICDKQFKAYGHESKKTCSIKCGSIYRRKPTYVQIQCCGCNLWFFVKRRSPRKYCDDKCRKAMMRMSAIKRASLHQYARNAYSVYSKKCMECGYNKHPEILVVHHKDENRANGSIDNLSILCPNCHALKHYKQNGRRKAI